MTNMGRRPIVSVMKTATTATLTPLIHSYMTERVALGTYGPKSVRVVPARLHDLARHHGRRPLTQLNHRTMVTWLAGLEVRVATNSRAAYLASARQFTAWLYANGHTPAGDACADIPNPTRAQPLPRAQPEPAVAAMLDACRTDRERAIIWLMVGMGLRRMEVAGLRWEHYDETNGLLLVARAKNGKQRMLPVPTAVAEALRLVRTRTTGPVIASVRDGRSPITEERVGWLAARIMTRSGVKQAPYDGISGHALRHTAATDVLERSGDILAVQQMLGHAELTSTSIYLARASGKRLREAMEGRTYRSEVA